MVFADIIQARLQQRNPEDSEGWRPPEIFNLASEEDQKRLLNLLDQRPDIIADEGTLTDEEIGNIVYFPWSRKLTPYPEREKLFELITSRNRPLDSDEERIKLGMAGLAVFGSSVGSNVTMSAVIRGFMGNGGLLIHGDPDKIDNTNLNRLPGATYGDVGKSKTDWLATKVSEANPYLEQVPLRDGFTDETAGILDQLKGRISAIVDAVDNFAVKEELREYAQKRHIPLLMASDVGRRAMLDVERYDTDEQTRPFLGRIDVSQPGGIGIGGALTPEGRIQQIVRLIGPENISPRLLLSAEMLKKGGLDGIPQLYTTSQVASAMAVSALRRIILGSGMPLTGRYRVDLDKLLGLPRE